MKQVVAAGSQRIVYELIRAGISVYSMHTSLDVLAGGVNDSLAEMLGIENAKPIGDYVTDPAAGNFKLVVFVPKENADAVAEAVYQAGAGAMGNYSKCGFKTKGKGTFLPGEGSHPAIGQTGTFETVDEVRFETIVPAAKLEKVLAAMRQAHPYEVPAFDVFKMHLPESRPGLGRIGKLTEPADISELIEKIKDTTDAEAVGLVGPQQRKVETAAVCAGSCGKIITRVIAAGCDLYVTGELKHHHALAAREVGLSCVCLTHSISERFILKKLAGQLEEKLRGVTINISQTDKDPFIWKQI
jgi:dinuclear metal center YbgI/SA1388 family protein